MNKRAFSLVEVALMLVIVGVVLSGGLALFDIFYKKSKISQTEELLNSVYDSLIIDASNNLCLNTPIGNAERAAFILPPSIQQRQDPFLKYIRYFYAGELDGTDPNRCSRNSITNNICGRRFVNFAVEVCRDENCSSREIVDNVAFVLVSGGWNKNIQVDFPTNITVNRNGNSVTVQGVRIHFNQSSNVDGYNHQTAPYTDPNRRGEFDDIVRYITLQQLQAKIQCENARLKITTDNLPPAHQNMNYTTNIFADGGIPFISGGRYRWIYQNSTIPPEFTLTPVSGNRADFVTINKNSSTCPGNYNIQVTVEDSDGNRVAKPFSLVVLPDTLKVSPNNLTFNTIVGRYFSQSIALSLSGGRHPYTCNINTGTSYNGLTFTYNDTIKVATISGTPTDAGSFTFGLVCQDSCPSGSRQTVNPQFSVVITCDQLKVLPDRGVWYATVNSSFNNTIPLYISGGKSPYTCAVVGQTVCNGITFSCDSSQAVMSGTPTTAGTCNFTCRCQDSCAGGAQAVTNVYTVISR